MLENLKPYAKAVVAFLAPAAVSLTSAVQEASAEGSHITSAEWVTAICACVITSAAVFAMPNKDPRALHQAESVQPPRA